MEAETRRQRWSRSDRQKWPNGPDNNQTGQTTKATTGQANNDEYDGLMEIDSWLDRWLEKAVQRWTGTADTQCRRPDNKRPDNARRSRTVTEPAGTVEECPERPKQPDNNRTDCRTTGRIGPKQRTARTMLGLRCWDRDKDRTTKDRIGQMAKR